MTVPPGRYTHTCAHRRARTHSQALAKNKAKANKQSQGKGDGAGCSYICSLLVETDVDKVDEGGLEVALELWWRALQARKERSREREVERERGKEREVERERERVCKALSGQQKKLNVKQGTHTRAHTNGHARHVPLE